MVISWTGHAISDVKEILTYLKSTGMAHLAESTNKRIKESTSKLRSFPNIGRFGTIHGTRELVMPDMPFIIVYMIDEDNANVDILRVVHTSKYWNA